MKFLEDPSLARLNSFLDSVDTGEAVVHGHLEAYSCKLAGLDKKLSASLDAEVQAGSSPQELSMSPVGPLSDSASRRTLIYLILTLNHVYPDYDFSQLRAHHFKKEAGIAKVEEVAEACLLEVGKAWEATPGGGEAPFLDALWRALDEAIDLKTCDIYSYKSDNDTDPFGEAAHVWAFNFFFFSRRLKRIAYLAARAVPKGAEDESGAASEEGSDGYGAYNSDDEDDDGGGGGGAGGGGGGGAGRRRPVDYGMANEMDM